jgi:hypothetical protein
MSVYVGIDVHRKRSQVAVIDSGGEVLANRNVPNGTETILGVIGGLPAGTPAAFEAAFGWGWLLELLEDYGFDPHLVHPLQCKAIASARLKNDKGRCGDPGAAAAEPDPRGPGRPRPGPALGLLERPGPGLARLAGTAGGLPGGDRRRPGPDRRAAGADRPA